MSERGLEDRIARRAAGHGIDLDDLQVTALADYVSLLERWNRRMNLTTLNDSNEGLDRLVMEPIRAVQHLPSLTVRMLDIGSGGGSPAVPMKLMRPALSLRMVESKTRKAAFLRDVVRQLALDQTVVECCRYEELLTRPDLRETGDVITIRAVRVDNGELQKLQVLLRSGGSIFLFGGGAEGDSCDLALPPLRWGASHVLLRSHGSRLDVLIKSE